jgi:hypothetical protein
MDKASAGSDNATQNASTNAPVESKFPPILRAIGLGVLVLILWSIDKVAVGRLPAGSAWRYVIGAMIISVGLATVISVTDRLSKKDS